MHNEEVSLEIAGAGGIAYALAASPGFAEDGICFAATSAGLYRSRDGGDCWECLPIVEEQSGKMAVTAVAVSPSFCQDRAVFAAVMGGILRSSDGGDTWFSARFPAPPPLFTSLALSPTFALDGLMLAGTMEDGVFSSTDRGRHWQPWNFGLFDLGVLCLAVSPHLQADETVVAGTETGLYRSTNAGRAWRESGFPSACAPILSLAYTAGRDAGLLFAGTEDNGLFISADGGASWDRRAPDTLPGAVNQLQNLCQPDGSAEIYALSDDGVLRSRDAGRNWDFLVRTEAAPSTILVPDPSGAVMFVGLTGKGIVKYKL